MTRTLQPMLCSDNPEQEALWVDAAPFRAHLHQLLAAGLSLPVITRLTGISLRAVEHLAHGRGGRRIRRIPGDSARRLLEITTLEARAIRFRPVVVRSSRNRLRLMVAAGWSEQRLADAVDVGLQEIRHVLGRGSATCAQLTALKIAATFERWETEQEFPGLYAAVA